MNIEISHLSYQNPKKKKNGDFCVYKIIQKENLAVLTIGDGVGSQPCDWKASRISCKKFIEIFEKKEKEEISERIISSISSINLEVRSESGDCEDMRSTFCVVVWDFNTNQIYYSSIGDSRIFQFSNNKINQISKDDVKLITLKTNDGKPIMVSGTTILSESITNVIGNSNLSIEINTKPDRDIDAIILSTDGFHEITANFNTGMVEILNSLENLDSSLENFYQKYKEKQNDDMTILVARKGNSSGNELSIIKRILNNDKTDSIGNWELTNSLIVGLENGIKEKDAFGVKKLLSFREEKNIDLGRENIGKIISLMMKINFQNGEIYQELLKIMRKSNF